VTITAAPVTGSPEIYAGTVLKRWLYGLLSREMDDVAIVLLKISHPDLNADINVCTAGESIHSNGEWYMHYPFDIALPQDNQDAPVAQITIGNVDRRIGQAVEALTTSPSIAMQIVSDVDPDEVFYDWQNFEFANVDWDGLSVKGDLKIRSYNNEPWPKIKVRPSNFPNLYRI
jgi:hypothetical protein